MSGDAVPKQEDERLSQNDGMARPTIRFVPCPVNVAAHDAVQISPSRDEPKRDSSFVDAFDTVGDPFDRVRDTRVCAERVQKRSCISDSGTRATEEHAETHLADERDADIAPFALFRPVGEPSDENRQDGRGGIGRDGEQIRLVDSGQEERECVQSGVAIPQDLPSRASHRLLS